MDVAPPWRPLIRVSLTSGGRRGEMDSAVLQLQKNELDKQKEETQEECCGLECDSDFYRDKLWVLEPWLLEICSEGRHWTVLDLDSVNIDISIDILITN